MVHGGGPALALGVGNWDIPQWEPSPHATAVSLKVEVLQRGAPISNTKNTMLNMESLTFA